MITSTSLRRVAVCALLVLLAASVVVSVRAQGESRTFPETGKTVSGLFWTYWQEHGGLPQQGYPISEPFTEQSDLDGKPYRVQYFERAVFEEHPENQAPFRVLLSQLGTFRYKAKYPGGAPNQTPNKSGQHFPETGHSVGGKFWDYWQTHGGLMQQGYPISDEFQEISELNGQTYTVQYFERAVFELHPENQPPFDVLLSQLGTFQLREKYPNGTPAGATAVPGTPTSMTPVPITPEPLAAEVRDLLARSDSAMNGLTAMKARSTNVTTDTSGTNTDFAEYQFQVPDRQYLKVTSPRSSQPNAVAEEIRIGTQHFRRSSDQPQWAATTDEVPYKWPEYNKVYVAEHALEATIEGDGLINGVAVKIVRVVVPLANTNQPDQFIQFYIATADLRVLREVTTVPALPPGRLANGVYTSDFYDFNVTNTISAPAVTP